MVLVGCEAVDAQDFVVRCCVVTAAMMNRAAAAAAAVDVHAQDGRHAPENHSPNPAGHLVARRHVVNLQHEH